MEQVNGHNKYTLAQALEAMLTSNGTFNQPAFILYLSGMAFGIENPEMCKQIEDAITEELAGMAVRSPFVGKYDLMRALRIIQGHGGLTDDAIDALNRMEGELTDVDTDEVNQ